MALFVLKPSERFVLLKILECLSWRSLFMSKTPPFLIEGEKILYPSTLCYCESSSFVSIRAFLMSVTITNKRILAPTPFLTYSYWYAPNSNQIIPTHVSSMSLGSVHDEPCIVLKFSISLASMKIFHPNSKEIVEFYNKLPK